MHIQAERGNSKTQIFAPVHAGHLKGALLGSCLYKEKFEKVQKEIEEEQRKSAGKSQVQFHGYIMLFK